MYLLLAPDTDALAATSSITREASALQAGAVPVRSRCGQQRSRDK